MFVYSDLGDKSVDIANPNGEDRLICVSAVVFKEVKYKQFSREWNRFLRRWGAHAFHATDFYPGGGEFERKTEDKKKLYDEDSKKIPSLIGTKIERALLVAFKPKEYLEKAPPGWLETFGSSGHSMAIQTIALDLGYWRTDKYPSQKFAYFIEGGDDDESEVVNSLESMGRHKETGKVIGVQTVRTAVKSKGIRGLEVADFFSWHWNKYAVENLIPGKPENARKDFKAVVDISGRNRVHYIFLTGNDLKFFFSQVPVGVLEGSKNGSHKQS